MISTADDFSNRDTNRDAELESKSQRKRNAHQITELAGILVEMKPKALAKLPIEQDIRDAIRHCAEIKSHGARKRQLHFVSKLLRETHNIQELQSQVMAPDLMRKRQASAPNPHLAFRDRLVDNFSGAADALRDNYPNVELQRVRQLVRNAHAECKKVNDAAPPPDDDAADTSLKVHNTKAAKTLLKLLTKGG